jgi:hypothetical protein
MTDDERIERLLREALRRPTLPSPSRDLWPRIVERSRAPAGWSWLDAGLAAIVVVLLLLRPGWIWLLAYHL